MDEDALRARIIAAYAPRFSPRDARRLSEGLTVLDVEELTYFVDMLDHRGEHRRTSLTSPRSRSR